MSNHNEVMPSRGTQSITELCAPQINRTSGNKGQERVWPLNKLTSGTLSIDSVRLGCLMEQQTSQRGNYMSPIVHPVAANIQQHKQMKPHIRLLELRVAKLFNGNTGLIYRKLPGTNGPGNSWLDSAAKSMRSAAGTWGTIRADHDYSRYEYIETDSPATGIPPLPDLSELVQELLGDYLIDTLEHPALRQLRGYQPMNEPSSLDIHASSLYGEETDDAY